MLPDAAALPLLAVEVPLDRRIDNATVPTVRLGGGIEVAPLFTFPTATIAGSTLSPQALGPIALSCAQDDSRTLIWKIESHDPCIVTLHDFCLDGGDAKDDEACLEFPCAVLPSIGGIATADGPRMFMITADGMLHIVALPTRAASQEEEALHVCLGAPGTITTLPLTQILERLGAPTSLILLEGTICIGTDQGHIFCLPADNPRQESAVELSASSGLLRGLAVVLEGFFGKDAARPVEQMTELSSLTGSLLCSVHSGSTMRIWDLAAGCLVHSMELLPPQERANYQATLIRSTGE